MTSTQYTAYGTTYLYDADGRRTQATDALGNQTWFYYDHDGRLTFTVRSNVNASGTLNAIGDVTRTVYNAFGQVADQLNYTDTLALPANPTSATVLTALGTLHFTAVDSEQQYSYDQRGELIQSIDPAGAVDDYTYTAFGQVQQAQLYVGSSAAETVQYGYDVRGEQTSRTDAVGTSIARTVSQTFDAFGRVVTSTDGIGNVTTYTYDRLGRQLTHSQTVEGNVETWQSTYDAFGRELSLTDTLGNTTTYVYNDATRSVVVTTPDQVVMTTVHNAFGQTTSVTTAAGTTSYAYDRNGNLTSTTDADNNTPSTDTYNVLGELTQTTDATGRTVSYTYDALGRVLTRIVDPGTTAAGHLNLTTTYTYDGQGRAIETVDPAGRITTTSYDLDGRVLSVIVDPTTLDPTGLNLTTTYTWDAAGHELSVTQGAGSANPLVTVYTYDALGRRISQTVDPGTGQLNLTTTYAYDANNNLITRTDPDSNVTRYYYDNGSQLIYTIDPMGDATRNWYDTDGRIVATRSYSTPTTLTLTSATTYAQIDASMVSTSSDQVSYRVYDGDGNVRYELDLEGGLTVNQYATTANQYDASDRLIGTRRYATAFSPGTTLQSQLLAGTAALGSIVPTANDAIDQQIYYIRDADGRVRYTVDGLGDTTEMRYDAAGRLVQQLAYVTPLSATDLAAVKAGTALANGATFVTDLAAQASTAHTSYQVYDNAGRVAYTVTAIQIGGSTVGAVTQNVYDGSGLVIEQIRYGTTVAFAPTQTASALATLLTGSTSANDRATYYVYDAAGRQSYAISDLGNIDGSGVDSYTVSGQNYDSVGRVVASFNYGSTVKLANFTLATVSAAVAGITDNRVVTNVYDAAGRLTSDTDALNQTESYGYDADGNRTSYTNKLQNTWTYKYDAAGRQVQIITPLVTVTAVTASGSATSTSQAIITQIGYDGVGNVISRTENYGQTNARTTQYVYDSRGNQIQTIYPDPGTISWASGPIVLAPTGTNPTVTVTYNALDQAVVEKDVLGNYSYKVYDAAGRLAYDIDAAGYVTSYTYDALGEQVGLVRRAVALNTTGTAFTSAGWAAGQAITYAQATAGIVATTTAIGGDRTITTTYDIAGNKSSVVTTSVNYIMASGSAGSGSPTTLFHYDAYGELVLQQVQLNDTTWANTYSYYDDLGRQTLQVDADGYVTAYAYNAHGDLIQRTEYATALSSSVLTALTTTTPPTPTVGGNATIGYDRITQYGYDVIGRKTSTTMVGVHYQNSASVAGTANVVSSVGYDAANDVTSTISDALTNVVLGGVGQANATGVTTYMEYDPLGRMVGMDQQDRWVLASNYDSQITGSSAVNLATAGLYVMTSPFTYFNYDAFGEQVQVYQVANGYVPGTSAPVGSSSDRSTVTLYDNLGRAVLVRNAVGNLTFNYYDAAGNLVHTFRNDAFSAATGSWDCISTVNTYDQLNRQLTSVTSRVVFPTAGTTTGAAPAVVDQIQQVRYDAFGDITSKGDTASLTATLEAYYTYDNAGRLITSNAQGGIPKGYSYNLAGYQVIESNQVTSASGDIYTNTWQSTDALGRVIAVATPSYNTTTTATSTTTQVLDRWGNVIQVTDPNGKVTQYQYNALNQKIQQIQPSVTVVSASGVASTQTPTVNWFYGAQGLLEGTEDADGNVTQYVYDGANELIETIDPFKNATYQAYDAFGEQILSQDQMGYITWQHYDADGRVIATGDYTLSPTTTGQNVNTTLQSYTLDASGNRIAVTDAMSHTVYNTYNSLGDLLQSTTAMGVVTTYTYDVNGNKTSQSDGVGTQTWTNNYWGQVTQHVDLGNNTEISTYDAATGELVSQTDTNLSLSRTITYFANGQINTIAEAGGPTTSYQYDANGNRTQETTTTVDGNGAAVSVQTTTTYDSHDRIASVTQVDELSSAKTQIMKETFSYDAAGNRREVTGVSGYGASGAQTAWYTYDADSRVVVANGALVSGQIVLNANTPNGYLQEYDTAGHLDGQEAYGYDSISGGTGLLLDRIVVDQRGQTVETYFAQLQGGTDPLKEASLQTFDADGHLLSTLNYYAPGSAFSWWDPEEQTDDEQVVAGMLESAQTFTYDADGRMLVQQQYDRATDSTWYKAVWRIINAGGDPTSLEYNIQDLADTYTVSYQSGTSSTGQALGYDAAGRVAGYTYSTASATQTFVYSYLGRDSWLQQAITGTSTNTDDATTTSTMTYDAAGRQLSIDEHSVYQSVTIPDTVRYFAYDVQGDILRRMDGTAVPSGNGGGSGPGKGNGGGPTQGIGKVSATSGTSKASSMVFTPGGASDTHHQVYVNGQLVASTDETGAVDVESQVTGFSSSSTGTNQVVVQADDTLQTLAQRIYGDSSLWYVLAAANGLSSGSTLIAGSLLNAPQVTTNSNSSSTFKPYNPADVTGSTVPSLPHITPAPAPHNGGGCGGLAEILVMIVAAVVTMGVAIALAPIVAGLDSIAATMAAGAIAGAAGALAGQVTGSVMGVSHFSWSAVGAGAIAGGLTAGVGAAFGGESVATLLNSGVETGSIADIGGAVAEAGADAGANYIGQKLAGVPTSFSWASIAASAVGQVAGAEVANNLPTLGIPGTAFNEGFANGLVGGLTTAVTRQALGMPGADHYGNEIADAFGNALGSGLGEAWSQPQPSKASLFGVDMSQFGTGFSLSPFAGFQSSYDPNALVDHYFGGSGSAGSDSDIVSLSGSNQADMDAAAARLNDGLTASNTGIASAKDPIDVLRANLDFQSAMQKFGGAPTMLYSPVITGLLYADSIGSQYVSSSLNLSFSPGEVHELATYLSLDGIGNGGYAVDPSTMALIVPNAATAADTYSTIVGSLGKFANNADDLLAATNNVFQDSPTADRSYIFNLTPLADTVGIRYEEAIFNDPRAISARQAIRSASDDFVSPPGPDDLGSTDTTTYRDVAVSQYQETLKDIATDLNNNGYLPASKAYAQMLGNSINLLFAAASMAVPLGEGLSLALKSAGGAISSAERMIVSQTEQSMADISATRVAVNENGGILPVQPKLFVMAGNGAVITNGMTTAEVAQAQQFVQDMGGGIFFGVPPVKSGALLNGVVMSGNEYPVLDGWYTTAQGDVVSMSLKQLSSSNPLSILSDVSQQNTVGAQFGIQNATMLVNAPNMTGASVSNFALNGPLTGQALQEGVVNTVVVKTSDGYITISNGSVTNGVPAGWKH